MAKKSTTKKTSTARVASKSISKKSRKKAPARKKKAVKSKEVPYDLVYVAKSPLHGKGMFAKTKIKADVTLGKLEGKPTRKDGIYVLWLTDTKGLEVTNDFRFINHASNPNCALTGTHVVTLKAIKPDEELTHDYGW